MDKQDIYIKKYPKSKNNFQCLGPCYNSGVMVMHPTQLEYVTDYTQPFCPVDLWDKTDPKTGKTTKLVVDTCFNPTEKENISNKELQLNILTPYIDFNSEQFLKIYYNIFSFEDSIEWIDKNNFVPLGTKIRIINASLNTFGETIDLFDNRFTDFFIEYIKKRILKTIYKKVSPNIGIQNDNVLFVKTEDNNLSNTDNYIERTNFLVKIFLNKEETTRFLVKYFKNRKKTWGDTRDHLTKMGNDIAIYIQNKINASI